MFKQGDKAYFHRGPVEFVGVVETVGQASVTLQGVEIGFRSPQRSRFTTSELDHLCTMGDEVFARLTKDEPAFAHHASATQVTPEIEEGRYLAQAA